MTKPIVVRENTFETWRLDTNRISDNVGDPVYIYTTDAPDNIDVVYNTNTSDTYVHPVDEINAIHIAINNLNTRKVKRSGDTITGHLNIKQNFNAAGDITIGTTTANTITINSTPIAIPNGINFATNLLALDASKVGIGQMPSSTEKLQVTGNTKLTGTLQVTSNTQMDGDLDIRGGDLTTNQTTFNLLDNTATTVNAFGAATTIAIGATTGTLQLDNPTVVGSQTTVNLWNTTSTTVNAFGAATAIAIGATTGTLTLKNPTVVGSETTVNLWNTVATTVSAFGAATSLTIGGAAAGQTVNLGAASTGVSTYNIGTGATATATTKTINLGTGGAAGSTTNVNLGSAVAGTFTVNSITSSYTGVNPILSGTSTGTLTLFNTNLVTVNAFGAATAITIGANSAGTTTLRNYTTVIGQTVGGATTINSPTVDLSTGASGVVNINSTLANTLGTLDGALVIDGGASIATNFTVGGDIRVKGGDLAIEGASVTIRATTLSSTVGVFDTNTSGTISIGGAGSNLTAIGSIISLSAAGVGKYVSILADDDATTSATGTLRVAGGIGIAKKAYVAGGIYSNTISSIGSGGNGDLTLSGIGTGKVVISDDLSVTGSITVNTGDIVLSTGGDVIQSITSGVAASTANLFASSNTATLNIGDNADVNIGNVSKTTIIRGLSTLTGAATCSSTLTVTGTADFNGAVSIDGLNVTTTIAPTGTGTVTINPATTGTINNTSIGATIRSTGAFTTLAVNAQITSTVTSGTSPLVIASNTLVSNLNVDAVDGKHVGTSGNTIPVLDGTNTWSGTNTFSTVDASAATTSFFATPNTSVNIFAGTGTGDTITIGGASSTTTVSGNMNVTGASTSLGINTVINVVNATTTSTSPTTAATFDGSIYRSAEVIVQGVDTINSRFVISKLLIIHNGTTADFVEYGRIGLGDNIPFSTVNVEYNTGNINLIVTPFSTTSTVWKITMILTKV